MISPTFGNHERTPYGKSDPPRSKGGVPCGTYDDPMFSRNQADATVFDYFQDNVQAEVQRFWKEQNRIFSPIRVDPPDPFELCDRCGCRVMPVKAIFTGKAFLCPNCAMVRR